MPEPAKCSMLVDWMRDRPSKSYTFSTKVAKVARHLVAFRVGLGLLGGPLLSTASRKTQLVTFIKPIFPDALRQGLFSGESSRDPRGRADLVAVRFFLG